MGNITIIAKNFLDNASGSIRDDAAKIVNQSGNKLVQNGDKGVSYDKNKDRKTPTDIRITKVEGPFDGKGKFVDKIVLGTSYLYKATPNRKPSVTELKLLKWAIKFDNNGKNIISGVAALNKLDSDKIIISLQINHDFEKAKVYAFYQKADDGVSVNLSLKKFTNLYLQFYATGKFGGNLYSEAAQTRLQNIKNSIWFNENNHKVHCPPYQDISEIIGIVKNYIEKYGGKDKVVIKEIGIFSHAGGDGPLGSMTPPSLFPLNEKEPYQMALEGYGAIDFNWNSQKAMFVVYGCDSALESPPNDKPNKKDYKNFAKTISNLSNFKNVEVWGQSSKSCPSFVPDYRVTSEARNHLMGGWEAGKTYQIAAPMGGGWKATCFEGIWDGSNLEHIEKEHDKANPMYCYKNGDKIKSNHQGTFNDHRKIKVNTI